MFEYMKNDDEGIERQNEKEPMADFLMPLIEVPRFKAQDPLIEVDIGAANEPR